MVMLSVTSLKDAGFSTVRQHQVTFGVATIYEGIK